MKYRAWIGQAVSALSDGNGSRRKDGKKKRNTQSGEKKGEEAAPDRPRLRIAEEFSSENWKLRLESSRPEISVIEGKKVAPIQIPEKSISKLGEELEWRISGSASSDTLPVRADSNASTSGASTITLSTITEPAHGASPCDDAEPVEDISPLITPAPMYGSSFQAPTKFRIPARPLLRARTKSSSSTIFQQSLSAPITIILTTPDSDPPSPHHPSPSPPFSSDEHQDECLPGLRRPSMSKTKSYRPTRATRSFSTASLPSLASSQRLLSPNSSTVSLPSFPDPSRLMPPSEQALDMNRLRKAQEFREIREFMISFLNAKGHTFPPKLRSRIMAGYGIEKKELDRETLKRFALSDSVTETDEGVALDGVGLEDGKGKELSDAENLRILSLAFQSQIPLVTPHLEEAYVKAIPGRLPKNSTRSLREAREMRLLGRTLSTSDLPLRQSTLQARGGLANHGLNYNLKASASVPNLSGRRPTTPDASTMPKSISERWKGQVEKMHVVGDEKQMGIVEQQTRIKRQSIISGAFGVVREAMGGSAGKERERRRMASEGR
ncbi:hypothetical protein BKA64DRAFT_707480 [Cadophora sp. MPI-SDFR-AT-0126]|nr:hypothetical protein BKA64DRAFT_707480 [Leotiomycetes sp. MPI-SDFR-AT-0126]